MDHYKAIISVICKDEENEGELELYLNGSMCRNFVRSRGSATIFANEIEAHNLLTWRFLSVAYWMMHESHYPVLGLYIVWINDNKQIVGRIRYI